MRNVEVFSTLRYLTDLCELNISNNSIDQLDDELCNLKNLKKIIAKFMPNFTTELPCIVKR